MLLMGGSRDEDEGRNNTQKSIERIHRRRRPFGRPRKRWIDAVDRNAKNMLREELEKVDKGQRCVEAED